ncbi:MAG TPA: response regulator transcription factor [Candidatus Dormibacteraeota bacterium]|nr:response regulator transcription factor [Candidatus Dormibacteraeota bacterium]
MPAVVLETQPDYRDVVSAICRRLGLEPEYVEDGDALLRRAPAPDVHLAVADGDLIGGLAGVAALRARSHVPLIVLDGPSTAERFLEAGADYHVPKPFSPSLLRSMVQAVLRRAATVTPLPRERLMIGHAVYEPGRRRLSAERSRLTLPAREADLLEFLALNAGRVVSRSQIIEGAWGGEAEATDGAVVSAVYRLRRKLEAVNASVRISTEPGLGYRLYADGDAAPRGRLHEHRGERPRQLLS